MVRVMDEKAVEDTIARFREIFAYEKGTGNLMWKVPTAAHIAIGTVAGTSCDHGYTKVCVDGKRWYNHQVVFAMFNGFFPDEVDHINGDRADNRIENLRAVDRSLNSANSVAYNELGTKMVYRNRAGNFFVQLGMDDKLHYVGTYDSLEEAVIARDTFLKDNGLFYRVEREVG